MRKLLLILVSIVWAIPILADDYDPANPAEPYTKYKVTTAATPYGYTSGGGMYMSDTEVTISTSAYSQNYTFNHWTKNGVYYSDQRSFTYTVEAQKTEFVAVYDYTPVDPTEPAYSNQYKLYLTNNISSACSFNRTSGAKVEADTYVEVTAYSSSSYEFIGWFKDGVKVSSSLSFNYLMPTENVTLTAKFNYDPVDPDEPSSSDEQETVAQAELGDINEDESVNSADAVLAINYYLGKTTTINKSLADMNTDNSINSADAVLIINKYLNK